MEYLHWKEKTVDDFSPANISVLYNEGYVFTRIGRGIMHQTRSVRIDLSKFELSSENRRILRKIGGGSGDAADGASVNITLAEVPLPISEKEYDWSIAKCAKDFYETKFGPGVMSAAKVKEMLADDEKSNFNSLLVFSSGARVCGYAICYKNEDVLHYSYPFYHLDPAAKIPKDIGLGMMIEAIQYAQKLCLRYIYLGSLQRPNDTYKLQFSGLECFDGGPEGSGKWSSDMESIKNILGKLEK